jgi:hypothetical protein
VLNFAEFGGVFCDLTNPGYYANVYLTEVAKGRDI